MTMGKNFVSIKSVPIQKPKLMKLKKKRKNIIGKVLGYLKSDSYLFAPLISQSRHRLIPPTTSTGVERADPVIKTKQKVVEKLVDYLKSDYHMYAPLVVVQEPSSVDADKCLNNRGEMEKEKTITNMNRVDEVMKNVTDETCRVPKHQTNGFSIETIRLDNGYSFGKTTGVKRTHLQLKETVKHVIQQKPQKPRLSSRGNKKAR